VSPESLVADIFIWQNALAVIVVLVAGIVRGFTGFGSALVMVPVLAILWSPTEAVTAALGLGVVGSAQLVPRALPQARWRELGPMAVTLALFTPIGTAILIGVDPETVRKIIAALILIITTIMLRGWQYGGPRGALPGAAAGAIGGVINGIAAIGGPFAVLYLLALKEDAVTQRANIVVQVALMGVFGLLYIALAGAIGATDLIRIAILAVPMLVGTWTGGRLFLRLPGTVFRTIVMWVLIVMSLTILIF
jgi:uncharacterized membrane protein YfcA